MFERLACVGVRNRIAVEIIVSIVFKCILKKRVIEENAPMVDEIQKSVYRIERIIKATLLFSKGIKAHIEPMRWSELKEGIDEAIGYYSYSKPIAFSLPEHQFILAGDSDLLTMMFSNFIFNAIDAIELDEEEEGNIEMVYDQDDRFHYFTIYDSGVPIEDEKALFEAFKSSKEKGTGLGLVLSEQIARAHGGDVALAGGERKGFKITLLKDHG